MTRVRPAWLVWLVWISAVPASAQRYTAVQDGDVVRLADHAADVEVSIIPSVGNIAFEMRVKGHNVLWFPQASLDAFKARPSMSGIPFVGPWANRLDEPAFFANGKRYAFDMSLGNVRGQVPIHGFLTTAPWQVVSVRGTAAGASVTSRLDVFRRPEWMKQWPFAHTIDMTYTLADGTLEVETAITNLSSEPMPIAIGFHPFFQLTDTPRDEWTIAIGARTRWVLDANKLPTGATEPIERLFPEPRAAALRAYNLDDVFGDLLRDGAGRATMSVVGKRQRLDVTVDASYRSIVVWAPSPSGTGRGGQGDSPPAARNFICFEPMAGITNALNLAQRGQYGDLQLAAPGATWRARFWVTPSGF